MKKILSMLSALLLFTLNAITAYAMPQEAQDIEVKSFNFTKDCEYIEILIKLSQDSEDYTAYNEANMKKYSFDTKELSEYRDKDGYVSLSCHFKDNFTRMDIKKQKYGEQIVSLNNFVLDNDKYERSWNATDRMKKLHEIEPKFKVAVLDKNGSVIQTSKPFELKNDTGYLWSFVNYDVKKNSIELDWEKNPTILEKAIYTILFIIVVAVVPVAIAAKLGLLFFNRKKRKAEKELKQI